MCKYLPLKNDVSKIHLHLIWWCTQSSLNERLTIPCLSLYRPHTNKEHKICSYSYIYMPNNIKFIEKSATLKQSYLWKASSMRVEEDQGVDLSWRMNSWCLVEEMREWILLDFVEFSCVWSKFWPNPK